MASLRFTLVLGLWLFAFITQTAAQDTQSLAKES
jgi:hypothetical protein